MATAVNIYLVVMTFFQPSPDWIEHLKPQSSSDMSVAL